MGVSDRKLNNTTVRSRFMLAGAHIQMIITRRKAICQRKKKNFRRNTIPLATEKNGDLLIAELAVHTKQLRAEEKKSEAEPNWNDDRVRDNDQRKIGG